VQKVYEEEYSAEKVRFSGEKRRVLDDFKNACVLSHTTPENALSGKLI